MYKDIIRYQLNAETKQEHLLEVAAKVYSDWMKLQDGFISWEINHQEDSNYIDIVCWESRGYAKKSESNMSDMPHAADWFGCYKPGSISSKSVESVKIFRTD